MTSQTTCPICHTIFRIAELSLSSSKGMVQCGVCGMVFDALQNADHQEESVLDVKSTESRQADEAINESDSVAANIAEYTAEAELVEADPQISASNDPAEADFHIHPKENAEEIPPIQFKQSTTKRHKVLWSFAILILIVALITQITIFYRDRLAANLPALSPLLISLCELAQCQIALPQDKELIKITNTTFEADAKNPHILYVNIGLENQADVALEYPSISLSLTNDDDVIVVVKNFKPSDFGIAPEKLSHGFKQHAEISAKLTLEINKIAVSGYRIKTFYTPYKS